MATNSRWVIIFDDKKILKPGVVEGVYFLTDDPIWDDPKYSNIWAIQYGTSNSNDEVEYRDETPHSTYAAANLGDFNVFIQKFHAAHLAFLQSEWDGNNVEEESAEEKISRLGARPNSYVSDPV